MSEDHFWDRVQDRLDRRLDPLEDDEIAALFLERPEWAAALVTMTSRVRDLTEVAETVVSPVAGIPEGARARQVRSWRAKTVRSIGLLSAVAALVVVALTLARAPRTARSQPSRIAAVSQGEATPSASVSSVSSVSSVFRVDSLVSRVSTVASGHVTECAEVVRDGRVVSWSTASERSARDGSFVVRSSSRGGRHRPPLWGDPQGAPPAQPFFQIPGGRHDGQ